MRTLFIFAFLLAGTFSSFGQKNTNLKGGYAAEGYDVVAYFQNKALKGDKDYSFTHDGVKYKFDSQKNLETFKANPTAYVPQYGGFCAYAIAKDGKKVSVDPETYLIEDGKLYLFYNSWGVNTLNKWNDEGSADLTAKADKNWISIRKTN